jgi:hypothetical protein
MPDFQFAPISTVAAVSDRRLVLREIDLRRPATAAIDRRYRDTRAF